MKKPSLPNLYCKKASANTQSKLKFSIEEIVTSAILSVFGEAGYQFNVDFETKNNRTYCNLTFSNEYESGFNADDDLGGSIGDVASFACRIALWNLGGENKANPIFILDESMKHLSEVWRGNASELLKAFCDKLGLQIILSTHLNELLEEADNIITVFKKGDTSFATSNMV